MTNQRFAPPSTFARWRRLALVMFMVAAVLPGAVDAARRNRVYLHILHGGAAGEPGVSDHLLALRRSLERADWTTTRRILAGPGRPDTLATLLVLHEADRRLKARDAAGARGALDTVRLRADYDPIVWYRLGEVYERAGSPDGAVESYTRGAASDSRAPWTEGRYRIAMVYQRQKQWQLLADLLAPLRTASDEEILRHIESVTRGGELWQGALLALGDAYEHLGRPSDAEAAYDRMARIAAPQRDWTLNRGLVYLARAKRVHGDIASALEALGRALDVATGLDSSFRRAYEMDTAGEAGRLVDQARRDGRLDALRASLDEMLRRSPQSPAAWYVSGLMSEVSCDLVRARSDYARSASLLETGAGAFLAGRPVDPATAPCASR